MRIDPKVAIPQITRETRESPASAAKTDETATQSAVVKLSAAGAAASAESTPAAATTTSRLHAIRAMLDKGDYPVDLDMLASRIVEDDALRTKR